MEGTTTKAMDLASVFARLQAKSKEKVVGDGAEGSGGVGTTKHPKTLGEEMALMSQVATAGAGEGFPFRSLVLPSLGIGVGPTLDLGFARVHDNPETGGFSVTMDEKAMYVYAALGSRVTKRHEDGSKKPAGGVKKKKKKLVRLDKEYIERKMRQPRPTAYNPPPPGYKRLSAESYEFVRVSRAQDEEIAAKAQKEIDRDEEMRRQYAIQGYADIEFTDVEDEELDEDWRPWAYRKAVGLVD